MAKEKLEFTCSLQGSTTGSLQLADTPQEAAKQHWDLLIREGRLPNPIPEGLAIVHLTPNGKSEPVVRVQMRRARGEPEALPYLLAGHIPLRAWEEHVRLVMHSRNRTLTLTETLDNIDLGLAGEAGELCDVAKKRRFHGRKEPGALLNEIGDVVWYLALAYDVQAIKLPSDGIEFGARINRGSRLLSDVRLTRLCMYAMRAALSWKSLSPPALIELLWTLDCIAQFEGATLAEAMAANVTKLRKRYPEGFEAGKGRDR